ncbi:MAG: ABC transporter ATP-binding protein [Bacteroidota bacterium]
MNEILLDVESVSKNYSNHRALDNVSLKIPKGSIFGLLGPNGAGKTTLIRIITQIIQSDSGTIKISGETLNPSHIRAIGYLPEERGLYKKMKVGEQLLYLAQLKGMPKSEAMERIKVWFKKLEISSWWNKKVEDLSKGMGQKIQFVATVLHDPKLIILDEPFSGFDPVNANIIKDEILELREKGSTIIFSTHRMESVEELCDEIALINNSKVILNGKKTDIKNSFRTGTFFVNYAGDLINQEVDFKILNTSSLDSGLSRSTVQVKNDTNPNDLLKSLINQVEVHHFEEKIPSMNDIFINMVNRKDNE